jgi:hypothetical protein
MKRVSISAMLVICLCTLVLCLSGCMHSASDSSQPGETMAEGNRRHIRNDRINQQEMMKDLDDVFLYDKPSTLSDRAIP